MKHVPPPSGEPTDAPSLDGAFAPAETEPSILDVPRLRKTIADEIDRLLAFLDAIEDPDLEPTLGFPELTRGALTESHPGASDDREDDAGDSGENDPAEAGIGDLDGLAEYWSYFSTA